MTELALSHAQQGMWFLERTSGTLCIDPMTFRLVGDLDVPALQWSLEELVRRHEALRTRFPARRGLPVQVITPADEVALPLPVVELSQLPADARESELDRLLVEDQSRPFDLARGPVVRAALYRIGPREHVVRLTMHHMVSDAISWWGVLLRELERLYAARLAGQESPLPPVRSQYAAFVRWQQAWLESPAAARELAYWKGALDDLTVLPELDLAQPATTRPAGGRGVAATQWRTFPQPLYEALRTHAQRERATPYMILLTAFQTVLQQHTGVQDVLVATRLGYRSRREFDHTVGFLVNVLPLRTRVPVGTGFRTHLAAVRRTVLDAFSHRTLPFERLVGELGLNRRGRSVVNVCVSFQSTAEVPPALEGLDVTLINHDPFHAFELDLGFYEEDGALRALLTHHRSQYDDEAAQRLLDDLQQVLEAALLPAATEV